MPFLTEHLWRCLVRDAAGSRRSRCTSRGWPEAPTPDETLLAEVAEVRRVVELGHQARAASRSEAAPAAAAPRRRGRPARARRTRTRSREELRVKEVEFGHVEATELRVKPNLPVLGPKLGKELARGAGRARGGRVRGARRRRLPGRSATSSRRTRCSSSASGKRGLGGRVGRGRHRRARHRRSTTSCELEGRVYDLIHTLNSMRKEQGLELTDRIAVTAPDGRRRSRRAARRVDQGRGARRLGRARRR